MIRLQLFNIGFSTVSPVLIFLFKGFADNIPLFGTKSVISTSECWYTLLPDCNRLRNPTADPGVLCCRRGAPRDGRVLLLHDGLLPLGAHTALRGRGGRQPLWRRVDNGTIEHCSLSGSLILDNTKRYCVRIQPRYMYPNIFIKKNSK